MTTPRLLDLFNGLVAAGPDEIVLYDGTAGSDRPRPMTRGELRDLAAGMAADLREVGVDASDCVAVWLPNWSSAVAAQLAALTVGAHVVGLNTRYNSDEVAHVLATARPRALLIAHDFHDLDLRRRLTPTTPADDGQQPVVLVVAPPGTRPPDDVTGYDLGAGAHPLPPSTATTPLRPHPAPGRCVAFTTSGSTGKSKVAAHDETGVTTHSRAVAQRAGIGPGDVVLGALPLSGVFGYTPALAAVLAGASVLLEPVFEPHGVLADMASCGVTHAAAADDLLGRLMEAWPRDGLRVPLRWIGIADFEGRSARVARWAETTLGATVVGVYGSSEIFALACLWSAADDEGLRRRGGGRPASDTLEVRVVDPTTGRDLPDGDEGELQFRGPNVVDDYLGDPTLIGDAITDDGWFRSGDLGRRVGPDAVVYVCRMGDALRLRGFLVDPAEIELRLTAHPEVAMAKVVGITGPGGGDVAVGFVVPRGSTTPDGDELTAWCASALAAFKVPHQVHVISEMPTTSGTNGTKIRSAELRRMARDRAGAGGSR